MNVMVNTGGLLPRSISDLATSASIDIEMARCGRPRGLAGLDYVISWFEKSYEENFLIANPLDSCDPSYIVKVGRFLRRCWSKKRPETASDVRREVGELIRALKIFRQQLQDNQASPSEIAKFRDLMVGLSQHGALWRYRISRQRR